MDRVIITITVIVIFVLNHENQVKEKSRHKKTPHGLEQLQQPMLAVLRENVPSPWGGCTAFGHRSYRLAAVAPTSCS